MQRVVVTGGSGRAGRAVVAELVARDYEVLNVDLVPPAQPAAPFLAVELTDLGATLEALQGSDAVVHLAAIPAPRIRTAEATFRINMLSTFNIFSAAATLGLERVVWASSETVLGLPFGKLHGRNLAEAAGEASSARPDYAPIDEAHPLRPGSTYSLSKVLGEEAAAHFSRWTGIPFIGLRFSNILDPPDYEAFPGYWTDPHLREWNLWSYVDARDVAQSCRLGLEVPATGSEVFNIFAADTVMSRPSGDLMAEYFPEVPVRGELDEFGTLISIDKARRVLGYDPAHSWRQHVAAPAAG